MKHTNTMKEESNESKLIRKEINDGDFIPFVWKSKMYGKAEFSICPQWKRGKLVKISIYHLQQENVRYFYEWEGHGKRKLIITSYKDLQDPNIWMHSFCKEHKCQTMRVYVPNESAHLWFQVYSDNITIGFTKENLSFNKDK